ncbi:MAG: DMT family transporter [Firmicutes bacterium]|nr:DMT family transporter [Bacillota bacterium]
MTELNIDKKERGLAIAAAAAGNTIWGFSFLFTKVAMGVTTPDVLLSIRFIVAVTIMTVMAATGKMPIHLKGKNLKPVIWLGITELGYFYFETYGVYYTNATFAGVVLSITPVVSMAAAAMFLKEYPTKRQALFCLLPIVGVMIVTAAGKSMGIIRPIGVIFLILTTLVSAAYKTINRSSASEFTGSERTYVMLIMCMVTFTFTAFRSVNWSLTEYLRPLSEPSFVITVLILSVFCSIACNVMVNYAAGRMSVVQMATYSGLTTICSMFSGILFLKEPVNAASLLGSVLILVGVWQVTKVEKAKND